MPVRIAFLLVLLLQANVFSAEKIVVLESSVIKQPEEMLRDSLMREAATRFKSWQSKYDELKTPEQIAAYQQQLQKKFVEHLGGFPERTPLNAQVLGIVPRDEYRVEKVLFESQPKHFVTGLCFVPNSTQFQAPYPGVLLVCGHSDNGKAYEGYQSAAALLALNGIVGFIIDPVCQGERCEHLKPDSSVMISSGTQGHSLLGCGAILLGHNTARNEIWDGMRGIDYLQQRDDVDPAKIGCMGNSGGGTQTAYLMALDDRIQAASPSCYITTFERLLNTIGPQDAEQNIFGQLDWGMDHTDYLLMRAPVPILMCTATNDFFSIDGAWTSFRNAKRIYTRLGYPERVNLTEVDEKHGWHPPLRKSAVQWMSRWLAGKDVGVRTPKIQVLSDAETRVTPNGQVLLLTGAKSAFDLQTDEYQQLGAAREELWKSPANGLDQVRKIAGIRKLIDLEPVKARKLGEKQEGQVTIDRWALQITDGIVLPALVYRSPNTQLGPMVYLHQDGKEAEFTGNDGLHSARSYAEAGYTVLAFEPRGTGETTPKNGVWYDKAFGQDGRLGAIAYLLGKNLVSLRAEDLLASTRWFLQNEKQPTDQSGITLIAVGRLGVPALHAAALEQDLFRQVTLVDSLASWESVINSRASNDQFVNCIHGAARAYDLTDLAKVLGDRLKIVRPTDAMGKTIP